MSLKAIGWDVTKGSGSDLPPYHTEETHKIQQERAKPAEAPKQAATPEVKPAEPAK